MKSECQFGPDFYNFDAYLAFVLLSSCIGCAVYGWVWRGFPKGHSISLDLFPPGTKSVTGNPTHHISLSTARGKVPTGWVQGEAPEPSWIG